MKNWPLPPFFKDVRPQPETDAVDALVFAVTGKTLEGRLEQFSPESTSVVFAHRKGAETQTLAFSDIKSIHLMQAIPMTVDQELMALYISAGGHEINPQTRPFFVHFTDGEQLRGQTKGFIKTGYGLFIFLTTDADRTVRIFIPDTALHNYQVGGLLGYHLIRSDMVSPSTIDRALEEQKKRREISTADALGHVTVSTPEDLQARLGDIGRFSPVRLGDILINQGLVSRDQMVDALGRMHGGKRNMLGQILVEMGALTHEQLTLAVADQLNIPVVALAGFSIQPDVLNLVPREYAVEHQILPLLLTDKVLVVAVESPLDAEHLDKLRFSTQKQIVPVIASAADLHHRIEQEYAQLRGSTSSRSIEEELDLLSQQLIQEASQPNRPLTTRQVSDEDTLVVRLVNKMIADAQKMGASDIHIEAYPEQQPTVIRFRVDGDLTIYLKVPHVLRSALLSRIKIMANLDISEHRMPQDGKIDFSRFAPTKLELRVAVLPTTNGLEDIVMRLLASSKPIPLDQLGMAPELVDSLRKMVHRNYGLILVCGPTGSGKTTTLHSLLAEVNTTETKIWTAEDPVEITHQGLRQIQMQPRIGLTFAAAMRAFLRADPDIIMVGEMRDSETTHIAIEASLTGHLVMSTLHTNSAPESVIRMLDMGLDPFNFADALIGVLSQRLARRLCKDCKQPVANPEGELVQIAQDYCKDSDGDPEDLLSQWRPRYAAGGDRVLYRAVGCSRCAQTGYKGRVGIYELMSATPAIKKLIQTRAPVDRLFHLAIQEGMLKLQQYGIQKVLDGVTDLRSVRGACA